MVVHAQERSKAGRINFRDVHDLPLEGVIIEAGEPAATILSSDSVMENAIHKANLGVTSVYENLSPYNKPIISP
jgi:predicted ATP-grasp superfamily ATP-dependent carboligase